MNVLVTGGAGYIGSHVVRALLAAGHAVCVVDDLSTGDPALVAGDATLYVASVGDRRLVGDVIARHKVDSVIHLAARIDGAESIVDPLRYYRNNLGESLALIETILAKGVTRFVFSSSAAVYGDVSAEPVGEDEPIAPVTPYGHSKLMVEQILRDVASAAGMRFAILRYFNVAGADPEMRCGQPNPAASDLVSRACRAAFEANGCITVNGSDYDTPDGSCVRDFIHVSDLARLHAALLLQIAKEESSYLLNCGYGHGYSVREVVEAVRVAARRADMRPPDVRIGPRRPGDVASVVADCTRLRDTLDWTPAHDDLEALVGTAFEWARRCAKSADCGTSE